MCFVNDLYFIRMKNECWHIQVLHRTWNSIIVLIPRFESKKLEMPGCHWINQRILSFKNFIEINKKDMSWHIFIQLIKTNKFKQSRWSRSGSSDFFAFFIWVVYYIIMYTDRYAFLFLSKFFWIQYNHNFIDRTIPSQYLKSFSCWILNLPRRYRPNKHDQWDWIWWLFLTNRDEMRYFSQIPVEYLFISNTKSLMLNCFINLFI